MDASSNRAPTRERLAEIAACVISGELDWGVPSMEDTDPWEIADLILKEFGRAIPNSAAKPCATCDGSGVCYEPAQHDGATGYEFPCPECNATRNRTPYCGSCGETWHLGHRCPDASSNRVFPCSRNCTSAAEAGCSYPNCVDAIPNRLETPGDRPEGTSTLEASGRGRAMGAVPAAPAPGSNPQATPNSAAQKVIADLMFPGFHHGPFEHGFNQGADRALAALHQAGLIRD